MVNSISCRNLCWFLTCLITILFLTADIRAQEVEFSSSLNPVGSGARATGMGGAFIGVADDATAASWNPAGLIQIERPEVSVAYSYFYRKQKYGLQDSAGNSSFLSFSGENSMDANGFNYASVAYPFILLNRNMTVSLNYQRMFELNKDIHVETEPDSQISSINQIIDFTQDGFLYTLSPALAVQVLPDLYLGATLNLWDDTAGDNGWETTQVINKIEISNSGLVHVESKELRHDRASFEGTNAHFGFLWAINNKLTLGGVYKTPFNADVERRRSTFIEASMDIISPPFHTDFPTVQTEVTNKLIFRMPPSYGLGLSYRHSDSLTLAVDVYRTEWSKFVIRDDKENEFNPLTSDCYSKGGDDATTCLSINRARLKDTTQVRLGSEYLFVKKGSVIPLRFGLFYDPEPATGHLDEYFGASIGTGYIREKVALDIAYQFRTGKNLSADIAAFNGAEVDINQHMVLVSMIYYFK